MCPQKESADRPSITEDTWSSHLAISLLCSSSASGRANMDRLSSFLRSVRSRRIARISVVRRVSQPSWLCPQLDGNSHRSGMRRAPFPTGWGSLPLGREAAQTGGVYECMGASSEEMAASMLEGDQFRTKVQTLPHRAFLSAGHWVPLPGRRPTRVGYMTVTGTSTTCATSPP